MAAMGLPLKQRAKGMVQAARRMRVRRRKLAEARHGLARVAAVRGPLAVAITKQAEDYAGDVLGWRGHATWLKLYAALRGRFHEGWIADTYYADHVLPRVNGAAHHIARHRAASGRLFQTDRFPDLAYMANGRLLDRHHQPLSIAALAALADELVFKSDHSGFGAGLHFLRAGEVSPEKLRALGNGVLQPRIVPHADLASFGGTALPTLRLGTVVDREGLVSVRTCYLKLGRAAQTHVIAADQVRVPVDWTTGALGNYGTLSDWTPIDRHPDSDIAFAGQTVPAIGDCVELVCQLHASYPVPGYLCWDVVVDAQGSVQVLEWEGGVVSFAEAAQGPCFADLGWTGLHNG